MNSRKFQRVHVHLAYQTKSVAKCHTESLSLNVKLITHICTIKNYSFVYLHSTNVL